MAESIPVLSVREIQKSDIDLITDYWINSDPSFLSAMGVDLSKIPSRADLSEMLSEQLTQGYKEKKSYCIIWELNKTPIGHSNVNKIEWNDHAYMHLHVWDKLNRTQGLGVQFIKLTLPYFFKNLQLKKIFCEPYALNSAPNKTLEKVGFQFVESYITTPGWINFEQQVNLWVMSLEEYDKINTASN